MSSIYVRDQIKSFIAANSTEKFVDLTSEFERIPDVLADAGIGPLENWMGAEFVADDEENVAINSNHESGYFREYGSILFHMVAKARIGGGRQLIERGDALRAKMRGRRLGEMVIENVTPVNTLNGATLQFEGGYMSGTFIASYYYDIKVTT